MKSPSPASGVDAIASRPARPTIDQRSSKAYSPSPRSGVVSRLSRVADWWK
jgi:hypothetical protein